MNSITTTLTHLPPHIQSSLPYLAGIFLISVIAFIVLPFFKLKSQIWYGLSMLLLFLSGFQLAFMLASPGSIMTKVDVTNNTEVQFTSVGNIKLTDSIVDQVTPFGTFKSGHAQRVFWSIPQLAAQLNTTVPSVFLEPAQVTSFYKNYNKENVRSILVLFSLAVVIFAISILFKRPSLRTSLIVTGVIIAGCSIVPFGNIASADDARPAFTYLVNTQPNRINGYMSDLNVYITFPESVVTFNNIPIKIRQTDVTIRKSQFDMMCAHLQAQGVQMTFNEDLVILNNRSF